MPAGTQLVEAAQQARQVQLGAVRGEQSVVEATEHTGHTAGPRST